MKSNKKTVNIFVILVVFGILIMQIYFRYTDNIIKEEINLRSYISSVWQPLYLNDVNIAEEATNAHILQNLEKISESLSKLNKTKNDVYIKEQVQSLIDTIKNKPESLQPYIIDIIGILISINDDYSDRNAYEKIEELINKVKHEN
jgi:hypothetical protein